MIIARLTDVETGELVSADIFPDADAVARANEQAQAETDGGLQWKAGEDVTPAEAFEAGVMFAFLACVDFGHNGGTKNE